jgi:hypothetical protein
MEPDLFAPFAAALVFVSGLAGLFLRGWRHANEGMGETRDLINRVTGLIATMSAIVLGLLIASANSFHNAQKGELEIVSAKVLQLDGVLRRYGPEAQPAREVLKDIITGLYERVWKSGSSGTPAIGETQARWDTMFVTLNRLRETTADPRKYLLVKATDLTTSINDQRLQMSLQVSNSLSWPFMAILVSWACLLFFGFGLLAQINRTSVGGMAVGALSVGSAIFLIVELSSPYSGLLRLSPDPILKTLAVIGEPAGS